MTDYLRPTVAQYLAKSEIANLASYFSKYQGWPDFNQDVVKCKMQIWLSILEKKGVDLNDTEQSLLKSVWCQTAFQIKDLDQ